MSDIDDKDDKGKGKKPGDPTASDPDLMPTEDPTTPSDDQKKPSTETRRKSAADMLMKKTRTVVRQGVAEAGKKKDMTAIIIVVLLLLAVLGIVAIGMVMTSRSEQTVIPTVKPQIDLSTDDKEDLRSFVRKTLKEVTDLKQMVKENSDSEQARAKRMDDIEEFVKRSNRETLAKFSEISGEKIKELERMGGGSGKSGKAGDVMDKRVGSVLEQYVDDLINLNLAPEEARKKAAEYLRKAGYQEDRIRDVLAEAAQKAGRVSVGNVAEPAMSEKEAATIPQEFRPFLSNIQGLLYSFAASEGRLYWEQSKMEIGNYLKVNAPQDKMATVTPALVQQVGEVCRVRRENLAAEQEDMLPFLVAQRDEQKIGKEDRYSVARLVWQNRSKFMGEINPGQMLSMAQAVSRAIGATTRGKDAGAFKPLDEPSLKYAIEYVSTAVSSAIAMGKGQSEQWTAAEKSLTNYLETARYTATDDQRKRIIQQAMAGGLRRQQGAVSAEAPKAGLEEQKSANTEAKVVEDTNIYFGPLKLDRARMSRVMILTMPGMVQASGMDLATAKGASALVSAWEQVPRIQYERVSKWSGRPGGGREYLSEVLPELLTAARIGETLGASPLRVAGGNAQAEESPAARVLRGVALGAVYGPFVHDETKAKAAALEALPAIEAASPLTAEVGGAINGFPGKPVATLVAAYDVIRPNRFGQTAARFQEICDRVGQLQSQAGSLQDSMGEALPSDGSFAEQVKLFVPFAVVFHDDGRIPVGDLMTRVRREVQDYAMLFAAEYLSGKEVRDTIIPRYVTSMVGDPLRSGQALVGVAAQAVPAEVFRLYDGTYRGKIEPQALASAAREIASAVVPNVEQILVREVVLARVLPRIAAQQVTR